MVNDSFLMRLLDEVKPAGARLYLVGGAVRDILLQRPGKDFDLVCDFDTRIIARALADRQKGAYYPLDAGRNTSRVILFEKDGRRVFYDFARLQGSDIGSDLRARDFTINAMAIDLDAPETIIDPLGGAADLKDRVLRACSESSFSDDPVRVIRAVRYAVGLNLSITPATVGGLKNAVPLLDRISRERNRDELLKLLDSGKPDVGLRLLTRLGILDALQIGSPEKEITAAARHCGALEALMGELEGIGVREASQAMTLSSFLLRLGRFKDPILAHMHQVNSSGRTFRTLDLLGAWINHQDHPQFLHTLEVLSLSNDEKTHLTALYDQQNRLSLMSGLPDGRQIHRFFKHAPVDLCFLWLADLLRQLPAERSAQTWLEALEKCEVLVGAWSQKPEILSPRPLLDGEDLMREFSLPPGRQLGEILSALLEEQAAGMIATREEAVQWVRARL